MRVLIVDDEPVAQAALGEVLAARGDVEQVDVASDGGKALEKLGESPYDLLLIDTTLAERLGELLNGARASTGPTPVVVLTAPNQRSSGAFEGLANHRVPKALSTDHIGDALDAAVGGQTAARPARSGEVLARRPASGIPHAPKVAIKRGGSFALVDLDEVSAVRAEGNYVVLQRLSGADLLRESLSVVAEKLRPYGFIRIHRSVVVNGSLVEEIQVRPGGDYGIRVKGGKEYTVTRTYRKNLRSLAELWIGTDPFVAG
jgi:two-component system LytT family response regulator